MIGGSTQRKTPRCVAQRLARNSEGGLLRHAAALARRAGGGRVAQEMVDVILEFRAAHLQLFGFLVGGEVYLLFDATDFVIEPVVFVVQVAEVFVAFEAFDRFAVFGELTQNGVVQVHGTSSWLKFG
jgi:hypothetical protein